MKILIADDSKSRANSILNSIKNEFGLDEKSIHVAYNSENALKKLRCTKYDILILDVVFKKIVGEPDCSVSYDILDKISFSNKYNKPNKVVGITAHLDDISKYRDEFNNHCFCLIEASNSNKRWKGAIINAIKYEYKSYLTNMEHEGLLCLTVHGIRTKGCWQNIFEQKIQQEVGDVKFSPYNYGYLDIISFFLPFTRFFTVSLFRKRLEDCLKNNKDKTIYIFSHSFGTYLVIKSLNKILKDTSYNNIEKIVLSGSVLKSEFDFSRVLNKTNAIIINDCGESDYILSASQAFVPNMGMAGKVGFYCFSDGRIINRHFDGGHSHYFDDETRFIEKFWIPLFYKENEVENIDLTTKKSYWNSVLDSITSYLGKMKELAYVAIIAGFFFL